MVAIDTLSLSPSDARACCALSSEVGWNQTEADWAMMLEAGHAPCIRDAVGRPVASALALPMGGRIGWISMVLVSSAWRRRGIAQRLLGECVRWLEARGLAPVLDATPAGQSIYARAGFAPVCGLTRLIGKAGGEDKARHLRPAGPADAAWIAALDHEVLGGDRVAILGDLLARPGAVALAREAGDGFVLTRAGRTATQIGPIVAPDAAAAVDLLDTSLARTSGPVLVDVMDAQPLFAAHLRERGFAVERPFLRMAKGLHGALGDPARLFAAAGPELG